MADRAIVSHPLQVFNVSGVALQNQVDFLTQTFWLMNMINKVKLVELTESFAPIDCLSVTALSTDKFNNLAHILLLMV